MRVCEIKGEWPNSLLAQSGLWERDIETLRPLDLSVFLRQFSGSSEYNEAYREIEALIDKSWHALIDREVRSTPTIIAYDPQPPGRITVGDLCSWLETTTESRIRAIVFGLETKMPIADIISLTWRKLRAIKGVSDFALAIADACPRHIRLDYVFWESMPNLAAGPLFGLAETVLDVSQGLGYEMLGRLYDNMILIHEKADLKDFIARFPVSISDH